MAMTMRRTRHKLEPHCDQGMSQRTMTKTDRDYEDTMKTEDLQWMKTHALASTTSTLTLTCSQSVLSHSTHCWVLSCASCRQLNSCRCNHFYSFFDLYAQIPCRVHTAKTGLLRCCLYTSRRLQQTDVSCKRSICNKIENSKINSWKPFP